MKNILSVDNMRKSDAHTISSGTPGKELMKRAAAGIYDCTYWLEPVAIVCGSGNNAGDGYALAEMLVSCDPGFDVTVFLTGERFSEDGRYYYERCKEAGVRILKWDKDAGEGQNLKGFRTVVDCLLGTGFKGTVRQDMQKIIKEINESGAKVISADINSGLNGDSGMADVCISSDLTVSIGGYKPGHFLNMAKDVIKSHYNCDIGIRPVDRPYHLIEERDVRELLGVRKNLSNKGSYGYVALIGGSKKYSGAIRLAYMANAAMRSGAGVVKVALPGSLYHDVTPHILESTIFPLSDRDGELEFNEKEFGELVSNVKTVAFGMGIGVTSDTEKALIYLLENFKGKLIIDADGLNLLSRMDGSILKETQASVILTPHIKEFSRLTGLDKEEILSDPIGRAVSYAGEHSVTLLLKGPSTIVTDGTDVYITDRGCPGMATAGSGDVLSGILGAVCAYIGNPALACASGAYINGLAGELAEAEHGAVSMVAGDTARYVERAIKRLSVYRPLQM